DAVRLDMCEVGCGGGDYAHVVVLERPLGEVGRRGGHEFVLFVDIALGRVEIRPQGVAVGAQGVYLAMQGFADRFLQRSRTEDNADGEGEEDRDEGDEVVAEINHWSVLG